MERIVDQRLAFGALVILVHRVTQRLALVLVGEGNDGRGSAGCGGAAAALEIVAEDRAVGRVLVEMDMRVDAAGQRDQARGVDLAPALVEPFAQRHHAPTDDADIALHHIRGGGNRRIADDEIVLGHVSSRGGFAL